MAEQGAIARPYAQAVFEMARQSGQLGPWSEVLHVAAQVVSNADVSRLIQAPGTDRKALVGMILDICAAAGSDMPCGDGSQVHNLLRLLAENGRLPLLPQIAARYDRFRADVENRIDVVLTAAAPVDEAQKVRIAEALKRRLGRDVSLQFKLDESLIGGARLQADDLVIDGTVRTGLAKLASALTN